MSVAIKTIERELHYSVANTTSVMQQYKDIIFRSHQLLVTVEMQLGSASRIQYWRFKEVTNISKALKQSRFS